MPTSITNIQSRIRQKQTSEQHSTEPQEELAKEISSTARSLNSSIQDYMVTIFKKINNLDNPEEELSEKDKEEAKESLERLKLRMNIAKYKLERRVMNNQKLRSEAYKRYEESKDDRQ